MGQILRGSARTTEAVRRAIQHSQKSLNELAKQYGINPKTVAKWRARKTAQDAPMGPKDVRSTTLSKEEEATCVAFRKYNPANYNLYIAMIKSILILINQNIMPN